jgi:hypothetical protein
VVTQDELENLLAQGHELRPLEAKGPASIEDKPFVARVARAVMAMGNLRDGGLVVIGVADTQVAAMLPGLDAVQVAEWSDFDRVSASLAKYSDPPVSFELHVFTLSSGADVVVLEVEEFEHDIHVCKKSYQGILQDGHTYVRPRGEPRSVTVPSSADMRELHNLAIDKGVREFVRRAGAAGFPLNVPLVAPADADRTAFDEELAQAWAEPTPVTEPTLGGIGNWVTTPAFTDISVRPGPYQSARIPRGRLDRFVVEHAVRLRGWPVPFVANEPVQRHGAWVAQDVVASPHVESWRMFSSGQFVHRRLLATELRHSAELQPVMAAATGAVAVWDVLFYLVEVAELGARMATSLSIDSVTFDVAIAGVKGRELISGDFKRELHGPYLAAAERFDGTTVVDAAALLEDARGVGVGLAQLLLQQFGLDVPDQVWLDWQAQVLKPG